MAATTPYVPTPTPYPVHVDAVDQPAVSRWLWLVKWLLTIPHYVVLAFLWAAFVVLSVVALFAILFAEFIYGPLAESPARVGKPLRNKFEGLYSGRRGDFRIVYQIADTVTIVAIDHRADIYRRR